MSSAAIISSSSSLLSGQTYGSDSFNSLKEILQLDSSSLSLFTLKSFTSLTSKYNNYNDYYNNNIKNLENKIIQIEELFNLNNYELNQYQNYQYNNKKNIENISININNKNKKKKLILILKYLSTENILSIIKLFLSYLIHSSISLLYNKNINQSIEIIDNEYHNNINKFNFYYQFIYYFFSLYKESLQEKDSDMISISSYNDDQIKELFSLYSLYLSFLSYTFSSLSSTIIISDILSLHLSFLNSITYYLKYVLIYFSNSKKLFSIITSEFLLSYLNFFTNFSTNSNPLLQDIFSTYSEILESVLFTEKHLLDLTSLTFLPTNASLLEGQINEEIKKRKEEKEKNGNDKEVDKETQNDGKKKKNNQKNIKKNQNEFNTSYIETLFDVIFSFFSTSSIEGETLDITLLKKKSSTLVWLINLFNSASLRIIDQLESDGNSSVIVGNKRKSSSETSINVMSLRKHVGRLYHFILLLLNKLKENFLKKILINFSIQNNFLSISLSSSPSSLSNFTSILNENLFLSFVILKRNIFSTLNKLIERFSFSSNKMIEKYLERIKIEWKDSLVNLNQILLRKNDDKVEKNNKNDKKKSFISSSSLHFTSLFSPTYQINLLLSIKHFSLFIGEEILFLSSCHNINHKLASENINLIVRKLLITEDIPQIQSYSIVKSLEKIETEKKTSSFEVISSNWFFAFENYYELSFNEFCEGFFSSLSSSSLSILDSIDLLETQLQNYMEKNFPNKEKEVKSETISIIVSIIVKSQYFLSLWKLFSSLRSLNSFLFSFFTYELISSPVPSALSSSPSSFLSSASFFSNKNSLVEILKWSSVKEIIMKDFIVMPTGQWSKIWSVIFSRSGFLTDNSAAAPVTKEENETEEKEEEKMEIDEEEKEEEEKMNLDIEEENVDDQDKKKKESQNTSTMTVSFNEDISKDFYIIKSSQFQHINTLELYFMLLIFKSQQYLIRNSITISPLTLSISSSSSEEVKNSLAKYEESHANHTVHLTHFFYRMIKTFEEKSLFFIEYKKKLKEEKKNKKNDKDSEELSKINENSSEILLNLQFLSSLSSVFIYFLQYLIKFYASNMSHLLIPSTLIYEEEKKKKKNSFTSIFSLLYFQFLPLVQNVSEALEDYLKVNKKEMKKKEKKSNENYVFYELFSVVLYDLRVNLSHFLLNIEAKHKKIVSSLIEKNSLSVSSFASTELSDIFQNLSLFLINKDKESTSTSLALSSTSSVLSSLLLFKNMLSTMRIWSPLLTKDNRDGKEGKIIEDIFKLGMNNYFHYMISYSSSANVNSTSTSTSSCLVLSDLDLFKLQINKTIIKISKIFSNSFILDNEILLDFFSSSLSLLFSPTNSSLIGKFSIILFESFSVEFIMKVLKNKNEILNEVLKNLLSTSLSKSHSISTSLIFEEIFYSLKFLLLGIKSNNFNEIQVNLDDVLSFLSNFSTFISITSTSLDNLKSIFESVQAILSQIIKNYNGKEGDLLISLTKWQDKIVKNKKLEYNKYFLRIINLFYSSISTPLSSSSSSLSSSFQLLNKNIENLFEWSKKQNYFTSSWTLSFSLLAEALRLFSSLDTNLKNLNHKLKDHLFKEFIVLTQIIYEDQEKKEGNKNNLIGYLHFSSVLSPYLSSSLSLLKLPAFNQNNEELGLVKVDISSLKLILSTVSYSFSTLQTDYNPLEFDLQHSYQLNFSNSSSSNFYSNSSSWFHVELSWFLSFLINFLRSFLPAVIYSNVNEELPLSAFSLLIKNNVLEVLKQNKNYDNLLINKLNIKVITTLINEFLLIFLNDTSIYHEDFSAKIKQFLSDLILLYSELVHQGLALVNSSSTTKLNEKSLEMNENLNHFLSILQSIYDLDIVMTSSVNNLAQIYTKVKVYHAIEENDFVLEARETMGDLIKLWTTSLSPLAEIISFKSNEILLIHLNLFSTFPDSKSSMFIFYDYFTRLSYLSLMIFHSFLYSCMKGWVTHLPSKLSSLSNSLMSLWQLCLNYEKSYELLSKLKESQEEYKLEVILSSVRFSYSLYTRILTNLSNINELEKHLVPLLAALLQHISSVSTNIIGQSNQPIKKMKLDQVSSSSHSNSELFKSSPCFTVKSWTKMSKEILYPGFFSLLNKLDGKASSSSSTSTSSSFYRQQLFSLIDPTTKVMLTEIHLEYNRSYKFQGN